MKTVLVCEDDESILEVLELILQESGYNVFAWKYCNDINLIKEIKPDLILVDLWFPDLGGDVICKSIKADPTFKKTPVLMISANNELEKVAKKVKADGYIPKPFDINEVQLMVKKFLKK